MGELKNAERIKLTADPAVGRAPEKPVQRRVVAQVFGHRQVRLAAWRSGLGV
jgi:hypothetical protein